MIRPNNYIDSPSFYRSVNYVRVTANANSCDNKMRSIISELCGKQFTKVRPSFLRNPATRRCLELDAYNEQLHIACEYNGLQHALFPNHCHRTESEFHVQQHRDKIKAEMCAAHGVRLIIIHHTVPNNEIESFLRYQLFPCTALAPLCASYTAFTDVDAQSLSTNVESADNHFNINTIQSVLSDTASNDMSLKNSSRGETHGCLQTKEMRADYTIE